MAHPQPLEPATDLITHVVDLFHSRRIRIASLRLLSLGADFFEGITTTGDLHTLARIGCLFQCLMTIEYAPGFSKPVDRAITRLLLHAIQGCEGRLSALRANRPHDRLCWQLPTEVETKEILEIYRGFLHYILTQCHSSLPIKDPRLVEAKRKLQKLCPRINNISRCSPSPSPISETARKFWPDSPTTRAKADDQAAVHRSRALKPSTRTIINPAVAKANAKTKPQPFLITPPESIPTPAKHLTVPTLRLSRQPDAQPRLLRRSQRIYAAKLSVVDGMVIEVTQPNTPDKDAILESRDAAIQADKQLKREYGEWQERRLRSFMRLSSED